MSKSGNRILILGAGVTGLSAAVACRHLEPVILEANAYPGGLSASYTVDGFAFERGGGHWLFGHRDNSAALRFLSRYTDFNCHARRSAVLTPDGIVPYPVQYHLNALPEEIADSVCGFFRTIRDDAAVRRAATMRGWNEAAFGPALCDYFFHPFNGKYTDGLHNVVAPQDSYKSPVRSEYVTASRTGLRQYVAGYNSTFLYPRCSPGELTRRLAADCNIFTNARVTHVDLDRKQILTENGGPFSYDVLVSTIPLDELLSISASHIDVSGLLHTGVLVINVGYRNSTAGDSAGDRHGNYQWLYLPQPDLLPHRIGYYSRVEPWMAPAGHESAYIEIATRYRPAPETVVSLVEKSLEQLERIGLINRPETVRTDFIPCAYTYRLPGADLRTHLSFLLDHDVISTGRYGRWKFQGILASVEDGLSAAGLAAAISER